MQMAEIVAVGYYVPEKILNNEFFIKNPNNPYKIHIGEDTLGNQLFKDTRAQLTEEKIISNTGGIKERRMVENESLEEMLEKAFINSGFPANLLKGIIIATVSDDIRIPSLASRVQYRIKADNVDNSFDIISACSGFTHAIELARLMIENNRGYYLAAGAETLTGMVDYEEVNCDLFGDGVGLAILGPAKKGIIATRFMSDTSGIKYIYKDKYGKIRMPHGPKVFSKATRGMVELAHQLNDLSGIPESQVNFYVPHQANGRIIDYVEEKVDPEKTGKIIRKIEKYGNMSAATVPVAFAEEYQSGRIKKGDIVSMVDMGAGLVFGGALLEV